MRHNKILFYTLGTISLLSVVAIPVWIDFRNKKQGLKDQAQELLEAQEKLKEKEAKSKVMLNSIQVEDIKLMDNVGLQYKENAQKKQFHLINPNWVTTLNFDKNKLTDSKKKQISYELKPNSLNTNDIDGSIKYTVLLKLENQSREININYDNLPTAPKIGTLPYQIKDPQKLQYFINKYVKKYESNLSKLENMLITKSSLSGINFDKVDVSQVNKWPEDLSDINWKGVKGLNNLNTPFKGDLSEKRISGSFFYDVDVSQVTRWPDNLFKINWTNVKGLDASNTPFKDDLSFLNIDGSTLSGIDLSHVKKWPRAMDVQLDNINFDGIIFTLDKKPQAWTTKVWDKIFVHNTKTFNKFLNFVSENDIKSMDNVGLQYLSTNEGENEWKNMHLINPGWINKNNLKLNKQKLKKPWTKFIDVSVKPNSLTTSDTQGTIKYTVIFKLGKLQREIPIVYTTLNYTKGKNPFLHKINDVFQKQYFINEYTRANNGDLSSFYLKDAYMKGLYVSQVTKWPNDLSGIQWFGVRNFNSKFTPYKGDISNLKIYGSSFVDINFSQVTKWPKNLSGINWNNSSGITEKNSPFQGDLREYKIFDSTLVDVIFKVTHWPKNLSGINWQIQWGSNIESFKNTPFKGDMSSFKIQNSELNYIDVSSVTKWPNDISGVSFKDTISSWKTKPPTWSQTIWDIFSQNINNGLNKGARDKRTNFLQSIDQNTIKQMDNVGLQYANNAKVKKLHLINPGWVTKDNIKIDKSKWSSKLYDFIKFSIKPNSLQTSDTKGFIKYTVVVSFDSENKEIQIEYNDLTISHIMNPFLSFEDKNKNSYYEEVYTTLWKPTKQIQWHINNWNKLNDGGNKLIHITESSFSYLDFKDIDVSQIKKFPASLEKTSWAGIIGLSKTNSPFKVDISGLLLQGATLSGLNLERVKKFPQNLEGVNFANSENAKLVGDKLTGLTGGKTSLFDYVLKNANLKDVDVSNIGLWPNNLKGINFDGIKGLSPETTPFSSDLYTSEILTHKIMTTPNFDMSYTTLKGVDLGEVTSWPTNLKGINWSGVKGLRKDNTPFKGDISKTKTFKYKGFILEHKMQIQGSILNGVDVSEVKEWPKNLANIDWTGVKFGENGEGNPFEGDISSYTILGSNLNGVDISKVTKWPKNLRGVNWNKSLLGASPEKFKENFRRHLISSLPPRWNPENITKTFAWVNFEDSNLLKDSWNTLFSSYYFYENIKSLSLKGIKFRGMDLKYRVKDKDLKGKEINWPTDLSFIDWSGVKGLTKDNTPFKGDISKMQIQGSILNGVDVSQVTKWPTDLRGINWDGVRGLTESNTPFNGVISDLKIHSIDIPEDAPFWHEDKGTKRYTNFKGVNVNKVTEWPRNFDGVIWDSGTLEEKKPNVDNIG